MAEITGPPAVDFYGMLSGLGDTMRKNAAIQKQTQLDEARKGAFSEFTALDPRSPDYGKQSLSIAQKLGSVGDQEGAIKFIGLAQANADRVRQTERDAVADKHWGADYSLRQQAASRANEEKYAPVKTEAADGTVSYQAFNPRTGTFQPIAGGTQTPAAPANPFAYGKQNEGQSKDSGYANRMFDAENILRDPKVISAGTGVKGALIEGTPYVPDFIKNNLQTPEYQRYDQASRNMINSILRRESGAAISQSEFDNAYKQYIPRPGDSPDKLAEKQRNRQAAIASIAGGGGQSYRPPYVFGPNGELQPTGAPAQGATGRPAINNGQPVKVSSPQQARSLPSGTPIILPDGSPGVVP